MTIPVEGHWKEHWKELPGLQPAQCSCATACPTGPSGCWPLACLATARTQAWHSVDGGTTLPLACSWCVARQSSSWNLSNGWMAIWPRGSPRQHTAPQMPFEMNG